MSSCSDVFDTIRRFHVYDHSYEEWIFSGAEFPSYGALVLDLKQGGVEAYDTAEIIVHGQDELQLVWEDEKDDVQLHELDTEVAGQIDDAVRADIGRHEGVEPECVKPLAIEGERVRYVIL